AAAGRKAARGALPAPSRRGPPTPGWRESRSGQGSHLAQQRQRALQVVEIAQVDIGRLDLSERHEIIADLDLLYQRILVRLADEVALGLLTEQPGDELLGQLAALLRLAAALQDAGAGDVDQRAGIARLEVVVLRRKLRIGVGKAVQVVVV